MGGGVGYTGIVYLHFSTFAFLLKLENNRTWRKADVERVAMGVERNIPKLAAIIAVLQLVTALAGDSGVDFLLSSLWSFSRVAEFANEFF
jgi:hypothetical protein